MSLLFLVAGFVLLAVGAEFLVRGASRLAAALRISSLVIGLTVVAFGTSAPELAVSVHSALSGNASIAVGNVVGSNILNVLLILGVSACIVPLVVSRQLIRVDVPFMILITVLTTALCWNGVLGRLEGGLLFSLLVGYLLFLLRKSRREPQTDDPQQISSEERTLRFWFLNVCYTLGGLVLLVLGSDWLVDSAVIISRLLGVSDLVIGLTVVAVGTSLPELVTSIVAARKGERDIAVGNIVGSNIFNLLCVLGLTALIAPSGIPVSDQALALDIPVMLLVALICFPVFFTDSLVSRKEGLFFVCSYVAYTVYLILHATSHPLKQPLGIFLLYGVLPLIILYFLIVMFRAFRKDNQPAG